MEDQKNGHPCINLELAVNKCKFYPLKPLAVLAGNVVSVPTFRRSDDFPITCPSEINSMDATVHVDETKSCEDTESNILDPADSRYIREQLRIATRCLVYVQPESGQVPILMKKWASECRETKKCTNWIPIVEHRVSFLVDVDTQNAKASLEECRSIPGAQIVRSSRGVARICDPPTIRVTMWMDQSKFYPTKLALLDGIVRNIYRSTRTLSSETMDTLAEILENGERCWLHVRSDVVSLLKTLHGTVDPMVGIDHSEETEQVKNSTGWVQLSRAIPVVCEIIVNEDLLRRKSNAKGALLLECHRVLKVENRTTDSGEIDSHRLEKTQKGAPARADRKERHRIFAEWLVQTYGVETLSAGSGVLDVAGGNGLLGTELRKFGVASVLLDPDPRCDTDTAPFEVIRRSLLGDGSDLTQIETSEERIKNLVERSSVIAGMHPDQATEAIIDTSLRLGKPFAMLPCCVFKNLNPKRISLREEIRNGGGKDPFRSYNTFCHYLLKEKAPVGIRFETENLPFEGRNKVVFLKKTWFLCQETAPGEMPI